MVYNIGNGLDGLGKKDLEWGKDDSSNGVKKMGTLFLFGAQSHQGQGKQQNGKYQDNFILTFNSLIGHR